MYKNMKHGGEYSILFINEGNARALKIVAWLTEVCFAIEVNWAVPKVRGSKDVYHVYTLSLALPLLF